MSEPWNPPSQEPGYGKTHPEEASSPSFPFVEREVEPAWESLSSSRPIPPPPPPPQSFPSVYNYQGYGDEKTTTPTTFPTVVTSLSIGVIIGDLLALCLLAGLLGFVLTNGNIMNNFGLGTHSHTPTPASRAANGATNTSGTPSNTGDTGVTGIGIASTGVVVPVATTPGPLGSPTSAATPDPNASVTPVPSTSPTTPTTPTPTPTAIAPTATASMTVVPLTVSGTAQDHQSLTMNIQTQAGATLTITLTYCDGSTDPTYNSYVVRTASGSYSATVTSIPYCKGGPEGTIDVGAHLNGYQDNAASATVSTGG